MSIALRRSIVGGQNDLFIFECLQILTGSVDYPFLYKSQKSSKEFEQVTTLLFTDEQFQLSKKIVVRCFAVLFLVNFFGIVDQGLFILI